MQHQWIKANLSLSADGYFFLSLFPFFSPHNEQVQWVCYGGGYQAAGDAKRYRQDFTVADVTME